MSFSEYRGSEEFLLAETYTVAGVTYDEATGVPVSFEQNTPSLDYYTGPQNALVGSIEANGVEYGVYANYDQTNNQVQEIILALSATIEGQTTALVIKDKLENQKIKITQLAYGVPVGSEIHYLDDNTLGAALESRKNIS